MASKRKPLFATDQHEPAMKNFKFAALAAALLLQSLASAANAPAHDAALNAEQHTFLRVEDNRDHFPLADINDSHRGDCDPEDDCPRPN